MIIQKVIRGMSHITEAQANVMFDEGIVCNLWRNYGSPSQSLIAERLTEKDLDWHQNHFDDPDPVYAPDPFRQRTPFISTTAGCVERSTSLQTNKFHRAWFEALRFATDFWQRDGYLFYCHLFVLGKKSIRYQQFSEEIRELNLYHKYSAFYPEGEIAAKIVIAGVQIEKWEYYDLATTNSLRDSKAGDPLPIPTKTETNLNYLAPVDINNIREFI